MLEFISHGSKVFLAGVKDFMSVTKCEEDGDEFARNEIVEMHDRIMSM